MLAIDNMIYIHIDGYVFSQQAIKHIQDEVWSKVTHSRTSVWDQVDVEVGMSVTDELQA